MTENKLNRISKTETNLDTVIAIQKIREDQRSRRATGNDKKIQFLKKCWKVTRLVNFWEYIFSSRRNASFY